MRAFPFALFLFLAPILSIGQEQNIGVHRISIRGDLNAVAPSHSDLFRSKMNGVIGGDLSLQYPIGKAFYMGVGGNISMLEGTESPVSLLQDKVQMFSYGPFIKTGVLPYLGEIFYVELSAKGGYRWIEYNSPICEQKGRKAIHQQSAISLEPRLGFWWDTGDGLDFGAIVGRQWMLARFDPDLTCDDLDPQHPDASGNYGIWNFVFAFSADLVDRGG